MLEEILLIAAFILLGAISGAIILNRISKSKTSLKRKDRFIKPFSTTKEELQSLQFERSLISQSITRVYEASYEGKIDLIERDRLLLKYKQQLDSYNKKIEDLQSLVDISELGDMRNGLVSLLEGKITAIDRKLTEISNKYGISTSDILVDSSSKSDNKQSIIDRARGDVEKKIKRKEDQKENDDDDDGEKNQSDLANENSVAIIEQKDQKKDSSREKIKTEEKTIDEIQQEIMHALGRLEQMDPDNINGNHEPSAVNKKRDALNSF
ncbi:MAG TPA: hypothetical protein VKA91_02400 [Nitrososphaeraceae archaeon]|nr:hypothetical protein [Nitrososphaeraceae archaeon]